jgi:hypothetical protein
MLMVDITSSDSRAAAGGHRQGPVIETLVRDQS